MNETFYRIEFPDGFGPHTSRGFRGRIPSQFYEWANSTLLAIRDDPKLWDEFDNLPHEEIQFWRCAFVSQEKLLWYLDRYFERFLEIGARIVEIVIDSSDIMEASDGLQVLFDTRRVVSKKIILEK